MPKADRVHSTPPTNTTISRNDAPSRRIFLSQAAGVAAGGAVLIGAATMTGAAVACHGAPDPILETIEAHKAARATWIEWVYRHSDLEEELPQEKCKSWADMYEEKIFEMDDPRWIECERAVVRTMNAEIDAAVVLVDVRPTTQAGICALLQYAHASDTDGEAWPRELQSDDGKITRPWEYFLIESVAGALAKLSTAGTV
jgi:hypothetical protein